MDRSLVAFAFLAQASRGDTDLLTGLAPLFRPIAKAQSGKKFDEQEFSRLVGQMYGLKVSTWAAEDFAPRLEKAGILQKVQLSALVHEYRYAPIQEELSSVTEADVSSVVSAFQEFAKPILAQHGITMPDSDLEQSLLKQLTDLDFITILLKSDGKDLTRSQNTLRLRANDQAVAQQQEDDRRSRVEVLCASFILELRRSRPELYSLLVRVASGALISEVVLDFQEPKFTGSLEGLVLILDAPLLMSLMDLTSEETHELAKAMCDELIQKKVQLATFTHCIEELQDNLKAVRGRTYEGIGFGATARRMSSSAFQMQVNATISDPLGPLRRLNVRVIPSIQSQGAYQYFTDADEQELGASLGEYANSLARERDAASVAGVVRLRRGIRTRMADFGKSWYVFVTQNSRVVDCARRYVLRKQIQEGRDVPPAITDRYLAGLIWVMYGGRAGDIAPKLLLANCAAALEPSSDVIQKMHRLLTEASPQQVDLFHALMTDERAGQHLMQVTLGDSSYLTTNNAEEVLAGVKATLTEDERRQAEKAHVELKAAHAAELQREIDERARLRRELEETSAKVEQTTADRNKVLGERDTIVVERDVERARVAAVSSELEAQRRREKENRRERVRDVAERIYLTRRRVVGCLRGIGVVVTLALGIVGVLLPDSTSVKLLCVLVVAGAGWAEAFPIRRRVEARVDAMLNRRLDERLRASRIYEAEKEFSIDIRSGAVEDVDSLA